MTPAEYQEHIDRLGLSQVAAGRFFRVNERTSRRWVSGDQPIPQAVAYCLRLMVRWRVKPSWFSRRPRS